MDKLPLYLGFFEFVFNTKRRGKALIQIFRGERRDGETARRRDGETVSFEDQAIIKNNARFFLSTCIASHTFWINALMSAASLAVVRLSNRVEVCRLAHADEKISHIW
jgi:hypothetical protein